MSSVDVVEYLNATVTTIYILIITVFSSSGGRNVANLPYSTEFVAVGYGAADVASDCLTGI